MTDISGTASRRTNQPGSGRERSSHRAGDAIVSDIVLALDANGSRHPQTVARRCRDNWHHRQELRQLNSVKQRLGPRVRRREHHPVLRNALAMPARDAH